MSGIPDRLAHLSPERRAMLQKLMLQRAGAKADPRQVRPREGAGPAPLSFSQQRLWFLDQLEPGSAAYSLPLLLRLRGPLDERTLARALSETARRHESLRTRFPVVDGEPVQQVEPAGPVPLPRVELGALAPADREREALRLAAGESRRPFDLARGPVLRAALARLGADDRVLLLNLHHAVADGWSLGILTRELSALYAAFAEERPSPLSEPQLQYADYAVWQRSSVSAEALDEQLAWWRERLAGAPPLLELPTDRPRGPAAGAPADSLPLEVPAATAEGLRRLAREEEATPFMVLLAAWQLLLARYSGQDDVVVGAPIAGRTRVELEGLIGFFANTLALRTDLSGDPTFRELVGRVRDTLLAAYAHQDVPFERLVEELRVERSLTHAPLFQAMFAMQDADPADAPLRLGAAVAEPLEPAGASAKFDLTLSLAGEGGALGGGLTFRADLWERATAARMLEHLGALLAQAAADPGRRISGMELAGPAEREQVVRGWNRTARDHPAGHTVHGMVAAQAARTPDAVAVVHGARALTYAELIAEAGRLAHALRRRGVGPEIRVGVCLERTPEMLVALLGVLGAGGAYVPLDPAHPADRLAWVLEDAGARVLVTQERLAGRFAGFAGAALRLDADRAGLESEPLKAPESGAAPENLAYIIYTSGSTGRPKGVGVEHRSAAALLHWLADEVRPEERAVVLASTSIAFDVSVAEIFDTLCGGGRLVLVDSALDLPRAARAEDVRLAYMVPGAAAELLRAGAIPPGLRSLHLGGEALPAALARGLYEAGVGRVVNLYGPTEATVYATSSVVEPGAARATIGRPAANARAYVLDERLGPAPIGLAGELYLAGRGVARGYPGRPGLTAERFLPDAFAEEPGARMYRTGDRVRWLASGELEYLGRMDQQVKVRGFRIEPGEVEAALLAHPALREVVVVAREDRPGDRRLVAYLAAAGRPVPPAAELRELLRRRLPEYMVPSAFVALEALPLTASGKTDRRALPAPEAREAEEHTAPRTPSEEVVAGIFAEVLGVARVGAHDNFFELGGHSLLATRVLARLRPALGVEVPLRALFEAQTVAALAARVDAERAAGEGVSPPPLERAERGGPLPLSFAQERLWFLFQMEPEGAGYNMPWPARLRGRVDAGALRRALGALAARHESLRTTFHAAARGAVQTVHPAAPVPLPAVDLAALAPAAREREARRLAREDAARPFDLARGPLLRTALLRLGDAGSVLLLTLHHVVSDGWSMGVLLRDLFTLYGAEAGGEPAALPPLPVQPADFAVWQRAWLAGDVLRRQLDWWRARLGGSPPALELPTDRPRPAVAGGRGASLAFAVPAATARGLRALARREGATLYMAARAALDLLLARWSGQEDLVVGTPIAGRTRVETEGLVGFFVNTLALRTDLLGDPAFRELLGRVRETALGAYAHQDLPFERLVEEVAPERSLSHTPLFQVMFALQNAQGGEIRPPAGVEVEAFGSEVRTARFDLELDLAEAGEELAGRLRFRTDLFDAATAERFAAQLLTVLAAVCAAPEERLSRVPVLPPGEAARLLAYGSGPAVGGPGFVPAHLRFAEQAARAPDAPAVLSAGGAITYAELDARAAALARRLRGRGLAAGSVVGVCVERGPQVLVALLAVWKAGGVYLPLDPSHPAERLSFLLRDSGAELAVTDAAAAGALSEFGGEVVVADTPHPPAPSPARGEGEHDNDTSESEVRQHGDSPPPERGRVASLSEPGGGDPAVSPGDLAYLVYTSGSTGTPKAVMVEHGQLDHTLRASRDLLGLAPGDVVAALAPVAFDIALLELLAPLLAGAAVRVVPRELVRDPEALLAAAADATVLHAVPALMRQVVETARGGGHLPSLRLLLVGGDAVPPELPRDMRAVFPRAAARVLYGPTEAAIICAAYAADGDGGVEGHPLGRPLPGVRLAVRGPRGELCPVGVPGELWIAGGGVARGYLGRPELTADRFVTTDGERAYRTGDRARWRPDGVLEFLGRTDEQVKVRGFRIEPGEVENVLRAEPGVGEAVVVAREDRPGDRRLVAYVVPRPAAELPPAEDGAAEQVAGWEAVFDETYGEGAAAADPTLDLAGWNSSYTGEPIPREEMREWVDDSVRRILGLRPERVLEIGCGTGLLLFRVAPHAREYHGADFSAAALENLRRRLGGLPQVSLSRRGADRLADLAGADFDTVVLNSVAQYFPGVDYLLRVLEGAAAAVRPGGRIFVGDVRGLPLLGAFHASVELARAPDDLPAAQLLARVRRAVAEEQELLLDPALFEALRARIPRLRRVEVQAKRAEHDNEVSRFRFDAVLHLDAEPADAPAPAVREWGGEDAAGLRALAEETASALLVRGVPDARVREHVRALERVSRAGDGATAGELRAGLAADGAGGIAPTAIFALGDELGRAVEARPGAPGTLDVLFHPPGGVAAFPADADADRPWEAYANDPQWGRRMRALVPAVRAAVRARLPEYMLPSAIVVLESLPLSANGKVDRAALPAPDPARAGSEGAHVAPRTPAEARMAAVWAEVLGLERVGVHDDFFALGGHSLLATQVASRVREELRVELPLRALFEAPTVAGLARRVEAMRAEAMPLDAAPPLVPVPRGGPPLPLSFAQQRLWLLDRLEPGSIAYNMPLAARLRGPLDVRALERTLAEVVRRHESLRTVFDGAGAGPVQVVLPAAGVPLPVSDLAGLPTGERDAEAHRLAGEEARRPFDLRAGPLLRVRLLRLAPGEHVLVLAMHHIVADGWSMGVLFRELSAIYAAYLAGAPSPLPELPVQYADFAAWQRAWLAGGVLERQLAWWRERLAGAPAVLEIPVDHPRRAAPGGRAATIVRTIPRPAAERVRSLARREGATTFMVLLAALDVLLARWSGEDDVVVGTPVANRGRRETEGLIGFFVNTLALRTDVSGNPAFRELLGRVRETALGAHQHQDVPFERLVEALAPERSLAHTPLFQVIFSVDDGAGAPRPLGDVRAEPFPAGTSAARFDLAVMVMDGDEGMAVGFSFREALWDPATMERAAGACALLLEAAAADAGARVLDLPLLADAERERVLREWSRGPAAPAPFRPVHRMVAEQAARTPEAPALSWGGASLGYAELDARAAALAARLRALGVAPEVRVAICLERSPASVVAVLAVMRAGGAYVPLDPTHPAARLKRLVSDAGARVLLTEPALRERAAVDGVAAVLVDDTAAPLPPAPSPARGEGEHDGAENAALSHSLSPNNLAYVVYTSGSTGTPKGVLVEHGGLAAAVHAARQAFDFRAGDVLPVVASPAFDIWAFEALVPLTAGGVVRILPREGVQDAPALAREAERADVLHAVPALMRELVLAAREGHAGLARPRDVFVGGDAVPPELLGEMRTAFPSARLHVLYGPTEGTIICAAYTVPAAGGPARRMLGAPLPGASLHVCDAAGGVLPPGLPGELCIGGAGVARGYLGRPDATAERFVPDPFAGVPGARMYRTGDRARWLEDGTLESLGRMDRQVKLRGFRVEPGEVEAALAAHPAVREAVVVVREDAAGERRLAGYVVPAEGAEASPAALREHLSASVPNYMVPSAWTVLDALPRTPTGKVDRRALPAPEADGAGEHEAPRTATEEVVASILATVVGVPRVGRGDGFFALGGHSLLATRVVARVREAFGVELPLRALFEAPTAAALAERVEALLRGGAGVQAPPVVPVPREPGGALPLSFAQQRLWLVEQLEPGTAAYTLATPLRLRGPVDAAALGRAVDETVRRHEALRTTFRATDGEPAQVVRAAPRGVLRHAELAALPPEAAIAEVARLVDAEALRPFDLEGGPLFRALLVHAAPDEWALLLAMHHAVSDGWSMGVLTRELSTLYQAHLAGGSSPLPEPPFQYADFAAWQRGWLAGDVLERQLAWWRERLAGAPPLLELPTDRPRSAVRDARAGRRLLRLPADTARALRELARREGATLFMTLLTAWQALLSRYAGQEDVVVGTPIAGRTHLELEGLVGFFVNTLALRTELSGDPTFREALRRVRESTLGAYQHQDVPFERLVEELGVQRSLTHTPLFQAVLSLQELGEVERRLGDAEMSPLGTEALTARFDLTLALAGRGEEMLGALTYRADLWDGDTAGRMLDALGRVLEQAAADPSRRLAELDLLGAEERRQLLAGWNDTSAAVPPGLVHERVAAQAARTPDAPAVIFGGEVLTFAELEDAAGSLARRLRARGVGPDARVGLFLERGPGLVAGVLGILRAGGAYLALDPSHPDERLLFMLRDAGAAAVVTDGELAGRIAGFGGAVLGLAPHPPTPSPTRGEGEHDTPRGEDRQPGDSPPPERGRVASLSEPGGGHPADASGISVHPDNLAYVVYTSGSTGTPKGVLVTHRGLANYLAFFDREVLGDDGFALPLVSRLSFDAHVRQLFPPLLRGEPVWVLPEDAVADPVALLDALGSRRRVSFGGVPSLWGAVMDALDAGERPAPRGLRAVLLGGEALPAELVRRTRERFPDARIWNHYGPTEATVNTTVARVEDSARITLGRPIANARVYLLDVHGAPVPVGVAGELYVGGAGVSRGYLGRPELTAEKFVPDPFAGEPGARLYRSGDRARWLATGELEYLGRTDQQVKVRGFRVEPGEIEAALRRHPSVRDAVVDARGDGRGGLRLVGYVVAAGDAAVSAGELRAWAGGRLPEYMVPAAWVVLEHVPLSANGKVDRAALPDPEAAVDAGERAAPRTATEEILAGIWGVVLQRERVGAGDDFFALGGHSLAATSMISRVRRAFGVEVPLRSVFEAPTLADLAGRVDALLREGAGMTLPPLVRVPRDGPLPLSFAQQRLWFIEQLDPDAPLYDLAFAFRLRGALDPRALRLAVGEVVRRHEVLRTRFEEAGGEPVQVVDPPAPVPLPRVDLRTLAPEAAEREARRLAGGEGRFRFDLRRGPLLRTTLLRLADDDWALLLTVHHIVFDGWSTGVFNTELSALYGELAAGRPSPLPEPAFQYADYAAWQRGWLAGEVLERQLAWWRTSLAGAPPLLELPTDFPRPAVPGTRASRLRFAVPAEATRGLHALARAEGATLFMALLAAWQLLLSRYAGQDDVVVGAPIAGRRRTELEPLVGYFVNTLALRGDLSGDPTAGALLRRVREATLGAYQHQDLPFERLVEELGVERSLGHSPVFQTLFAVQNHQRTAMRLEGLRLESFPTEEDAARTDLGLTLVEGGERLLGVLTFRTDLWEAATMERLLGHFTRLLDEVAAGSGRRLSELSLMGGAEREQLLVSWNAAPREAPRRCVHELFAEQAARTPDAVAVSSGTAALTYAELARRADAVARALRERGVGPEAPVGVCVERSPEMVAAVLGVLRAGGAFLPLDPEYPAERLAFMLEDSGARVLLTDGAAGEKLADFGGEVVALDTPHPPAPSPTRGEGEHDGSEDGAAVAGCSLFPIPCSLSLAYVIYTSGSTGTPKGVAVPHGALAGTLLAAGAAFGFGAGDVMASLASFAFDIWLLEALLPLLSGGSVRIVPRERVVDVDALVEELEGATHLHAVPALMRRVVDRVAAGRGTLPALRSAFVGGDAVPPELPAAMRAVFPAAAVRVLYGPTEGAIICAAHHARGGEARGRYLLGGPLGNAPLYVLDAAGEPAPVGVPGELCIGGGGTARGYVGAAEPTAARFVPDPFAAARTAGARMYRSGDRVRWLPDGTLEFLGRMDGQVKVRGFRIEPGEIETVLRAHPGVRAAIVVAREDSPGERRLVAYLAADGEPPSADELRARLRASLPEHMVPAAFVVLDALPLTRNGKLDRAALPAPERAGGARGWAPPRTPTEEVLAGIWTEVLGVEGVDADDDFFALGGHSLLATRVASRVRSALGAELPLRAVFEASTLAGLARRIDRLRPDAAAGGGPPPLLPAARDDAPLPLSFAQERLWILDRLDPGGSAYNMPLALRLRGSLDARALARAVGGMVRRHEALRTTFGDDGGTPFQVVHAAGIAAPGVADLSGLAAAARDAEAGRRAEECARRPFDLRRGPLLRVHLLRLAAEEHVLVLAMHHVVSDGWSTGVMLRELSALYEAYLAGAPSPLPAPPAQYADFAAWQRGWLAGEVLERELAWWRAELAGAPAALELPTDHPRPPLPGARAASAVRVLPRDTADAVRALARREGATTFMVLVAALDVLLARWSGEDDVVVGTPVANRTRRETEELVGFFANTLVLRVDASGSPAFRGLLARVRGATLGAYQHQDVPFERLVDALGVERTTGRTPLFQVMFSTGDGAAAPFPFGGILAEPHPTGTPAAKFDLAVSVSEGGAGLGVRFAYREELWDAATVERVAEAYARLLEAAAADPSRPTLDLPLLGAAERERVLREWSPGPPAPPPPRAVHESVAEQALRTPDAAAVTYGGRALTYAGLVALAAALAARLRARGAGPEARVAVCLERSPAWVVAVLAVLKAGAAYVPLDPAHPDERLRATLADAGALLLVTEPHLRRRLVVEGVEAVLVDDTATPFPPTPSPLAGDRRGHVVGEGGRVDAMEPVDPENLACVVYTSGSTGTPKGVLVTHGGLAATLRGAREAFGFRPGEVSLVLASPAFDIWAFEALLPLTLGGTARILPREDVRDVARLAAEVERADALHAVPALMRELARAAREGRADFARVRRVFVGGDAVPPELLREVREAFPAAEASVLYGPTEDTIICAAHAVRGDGGSARAMLGVPLPGAWLCVCDAAGGVVPPGMPGELWIGGAGTARGYLGRPELTAERFVPDALSGRAGARLYRTGDRARWLPDGTLEFLGRVDRQVKVRGFRIEPGEVEAALERHPAVRAAAVVVREDRPGDRRLVAYLAADAAVSPDELRELARATLPDYMVPAAWVVLDALPLTPTGKLDRRALPAPDAPAADDGAEPRTELERAVAAVWAEVLGVPAVGTGASFFDLGGNSLLVVRAAARLEAELDRPVPALDLFQHPSVAALARHLAGAEDAQPAAPAGPDRSDRLAAGKGRLGRLRNRK